MTTLRRARRTTAALALVLSLAACSSDDTAQDDAADVSPSQSTQATTTPSSSAVPAVPSAPGAAPSRLGQPGATVVPAPGTTAGGIPSNTSPSPVSTAPPGPAAKRLSAAPGGYTLDTTGTFTSDLGGEQPVDSESSLRIDPARGDDQHSSLSGEQGSTEQTVRFSASSIDLVQLKLTTPAFVKEFRPIKPVQLLPQPPAVGRTWKWTIISTDNATTAALEAKVARKETIVIGGEKVATTVVTSTLTLSGDIDAVSKMETWVADRYQLTVKEHAVTTGMIQAVRFSSDTTSVMRSTKPTR
ncbi:MAG TPA: hypothetical protein VNB94_00730 [Mycobacteriales bacterium]|nr:hypothetical protein [Mycobacteriales bacterium]